MSSGCSKSGTSPDGLQCLVPFPSAFSFPASPSACRGPPSASGRLPCALSPASASSAAAARAPLASSTSASLCLFWDLHDYPHQILHADRKCELLAICLINIVIHRHVMTRVNMSMAQTKYRYAWPAKQEAVALLWLRLILCYLVSLPSVTEAAFPALIDRSVISDR